MNKRAGYVAGLLVWAVAMGAGLSVRAAETQRQYLSGLGKDDGVAWDFFCTAGQNANKWSTIKVPSNWELQGFGIYTYGRERHQDGWPKVEGRYKRSFDVPANWSDKKVFLVFEGVMTDTEARVNGQSAGPKHQGGFYCFKYDVTKLVKPGASNQLEVTVQDESADPSVNRAERRGDFWNYGGIYRPVYLEAVPQQYLERVAIDAKADGTIAADVVVGEAPREGGTVEAQVLDLAGKPVGDAFRQPAAAGTVRVSSKIDGPRLWTAETPNLYQLEVRLKQGDQVIHSIRRKFGFRTLEVRTQKTVEANPGVYVNGKRIMFQGACRHSFWPDSGRCLSPQISRDDVQLMKDMNMNAVRMSHYPPDDHFLDACDELGLYVLDEIAGWHGHYDTPVGRKLVEEMVTHDVNHPSVLFWDNGNEGGFNNDLNDDYAKWDPQKRPVLHPWELFRGIDTKHYPNYADLMAKCAGPNVYFATEMLHGLYDGGAGAGLEDYWKVFRQSDVGSGGFIWALLDEDVKRTDLGGKLDPHKNEAPDGIVGPYREKEGSYYTIKELWSPVQVVDLAPPKDLVFTLENRYSFTDLDRCSFTWQYRKLAQPGESGPAFSVEQEGAAHVEGSIAPGARGKLKLEIPQIQTLRAMTIDALALTAKDPTGRELWTWVWPMKDLNRYRDLATASPAIGKITTTESGDILTVSVENLSLRFNTRTGMLDTVKRIHGFSLYNGPRLVTGGGTCTGFDQKMDGDDLVLKAIYEGDLHSITYRIRPNGWMTMDWAYAMTGPHPFFGLGFDYSENNARSVRFLGQGPYRVWKNRQRGGTLGVWEKAYNNTVTGDPEDTVDRAGNVGKLEYPEFKGYHAGVRWFQLQTSEGPITGLINQDDLYVEFFRPQFPPTRYEGKTGVNFPSTDIAFLNGIPPVGSKFVPAAVTGPSAQEAVAQGEYKGSVSLFFGELPASRGAAAR